MSAKKAVLFLLPECPGYFTRLCYEMGKTLRDQGYDSVYACTTPFYEKFKGVNLSEVGKVYYLNDFLNDTIDKNLDDIKIDNWSYYASFSRQSWQFGKPLGNLKAFQKTKSFFQTIFNETHPAILISEGVSNSFLYLAHQQASRNGIPFFGLMGSRIPNHFNIHLDVVGNEVAINPHTTGKYVPTNEVPDYMKNSQFAGLFDRKNFFLSRSFYKELFQFITLRSYNSLEVGNTKWYVLKAYRTALRRILSDLYFRKVLSVYTPGLIFKSDTTYIVYPLHFYPEASTSVMAKYYDGNEYNIIKNIAFSLPKDSILIVKEHKSNVGNNSRLFYKKIKQLPNTVLLHPYFNLKDNIHKFDAVVTLTSTVGFEALTKNVPVYVLGEVFYQKYPGAHKIESYAQLEDALKLVKKKIDTSETSHTFDIYSRICFPGSFNYMATHCLHKDNVKLLLRPVLEFLETKKIAIHRNS